MAKKKVKNSILNTYKKDGEVSRFSYSMGMLFTYGYGVHEICWENLEVRWLPADIKGRLFPTIEEHYSEANAIFQQDLAPLRNLQSTKKWLTERNIKILFLPANSLDLNPIENVWNDIKKAIRNEKVLTRTKAELKSVITRVLDNLSENTID